MKQKYAYQGDAKQTAKALGKSLPISTKQSVEICKAIKGKTVARARTMLEDAIAKKGAIRFTRFTEGAGHKSGKGPGKYPVKACTNIVKILNSAEANAQDQGLGADLIVEHANAHQGSQSFKYGRHARRKNKSTHVEIVVREATEADKPKKKSKKSKKESEKTQKSKKEEKSEKKADKKDDKDSKKEQTAGSKASSEKKSDASGKDDKDSSASKGSSGKGKSDKKSGKDSKKSEEDKE